MSRIAALEAAFDGAEEGLEGADLTEKVETHIEETRLEQPEPEVRDRPREPDGKFTRAPKESKPTGKQAPGQKQATDEYAAPPKSWKQEYHQHYAGLTPDVRKYLHMREQEQNAGVEPLKLRAQRADLLEQALGPVMGDLQMSGVGVDSFLRDIAQTVLTLKNGTVEQKVQTLNRIAQQYGVVAAQQVANTAAGATNPELAKLQDKLGEFENRFRQEDEQRERAEWEAVDTSMRQFGDQKTETGEPKFPHFADANVRVTMGRLIQTGEANSLESAYTKAIRLHDDIWKQEQERESAANAAIRRQETQRVAIGARRAAVSPRSSSPTGASEGSGKVDRRASLMSAFDELGGGGRI